MSDETNLKTKSKLNKKLLIGAVAVIAIALIAVLVIFVPKPADAKKLEEQLSLGDKYLRELDYEQAEAAYLAVIEIDPKNVDAYLGLADVYIAQGEYDMASEVLEDALEELEGENAEEVKGKLDEVEQLRQAAEATPTIAPTSTPVPTATNTPVPIATNTPVPTATSTPIPTVTNTPVPTVTNTPIPTATNTPIPTATSTPSPFPTNTPTPEPTATPTLAPTVTPTPTPLPKEGENRVEVSLSDDCFAYTTYQEHSVCAGLSEKGYEEFKQYDASYLVSITLPSVAPDGNEVVGFYSESDTGYSLAELLNENSACLELVCPENYTIYYGICEERPDEKYADKLKQVVLNEGLTEIAARAFQGCTGITEIEIPESVVTIGNYAFSGCNNLMIEEMEAGEKTIGQGAFNYVHIKKLKVGGEVIVQHLDSAWAEGSFMGAEIGTVEFAEGLKSISAYLLWECESVTEIKIPDSVTEICESAFRDCTGIEEVAVPNLVTMLGDNVFNGCTNLKQVKLPASLAEVGQGAFSGCSALNQMELPENLITIRGGAFSGCTGLVLEEFEVAGKTIGQNAFEGVHINVLKVSGDVTVQVLNSRWASGSFRGAVIGDVKLSDNLKNLSDYLFWECESLTKVEIPDSVIEIGGNTFRDCVNVVVVASAGSYAESYAIEHGISVENP